MDKNKIDIKENYIYRLDNELLTILLRDRSSGKNIIWATDNYSSRGCGYQSNDYITVEAITGYHGNIIKPRTEKSKKEQTDRIRDKAEVFTPSWICNKQNNLVDNAWFGTDFVFNEETEKAWVATTESIAFLTKNTVISISDIIDCIDEPNNTRIARNLGISKIVLEGMLAHTDKFVLSRLDYKIHNLNQLSHDDSVEPITRASVSVQKFGKLGESEVITPKHICKDMIDMIDDANLRAVMDSGSKVLDIAGKVGEFALAVFEKYIALGYDKDALKDAIYTIPTSGITYEFTRMIYEILGLNVDNIASKFTSYSLLEVKNEDGDIDYTKIAALLRQNKPFDSITMNDEIIEGDEIVNFDIAVGNPPYQEEGFDNGRKLPIYDSFMDISYTISQQAVLITPARFLFEAGQTTKDWNRKMLNDEHFRVMMYEPDASTIFSNAEIKGGVKDVDTKEFKSVMEGYEGYDHYKIDDLTYIRFNTSAFLSNYKRNDLLNSRL